MSRTMTKLGSAWRIREICSALIAASLMMHASGAALAQAERTAREAALTVSIAAGTLDNSLREYAELAGLQLVYAPELVTGLRSHGLSGTFRVRDGLERLLDGTGLRYRFVSDRAVTLEKRVEGGVRTLGPVRVEGGGTAAVSGINGSRDVTATEGTGSLTTGAMTIGTKAPRSIKDTPQSVSVITSEQLEQQGINDFTQALQQAPGISFAQGSGSLETTFYSRGFEITSIQIDGGSPLTTRFAGGTGLAYFPQIDLSQYDHVEVLRGAAGVFNGYGDPSGTINLVRKKPLAHEQVTIDAEGGSWSHYRTTLDAAAPLGFDDSLRGRMVLTWQSNEHFYRVAEDEKTLIYGIVEYDLTPATLLTAGFSQTNQDSVPWRGGLPRYQTGDDPGLSRQTCLCFPWNRWDFDTTEMFGSIERTLGEDWSAKLNVTRNEQASTNKLGYYTTGAINPIDRRGPRLVGSYTDYASDQLAAEATLSGAFMLFGQRQEVTAGVSRSDQDGGGRLLHSALIPSSAAQPYQPYPGGPRYCTTVSVCPTGIATPPIDVFAFDPFDPLYTEPANSLPSTRYPEQGQVQTLTYANFSFMAFDRFHLQTGLRWSRYENRSTAQNLCTSIPASGTPAPTNCVGRQIGDVFATTSSFYEGEELSWPPSVALSWDLSKSWVTYLAYSDIYVDQSNLLDGDLEPLDPVVGRNVEAGTKWSVRDGRLNAAIAVYRVQQKGFAERDTNVPPAQPDPHHDCCWFQRKDRTQLSEGIDAEVTGEVIPGWQIAASYTFGRNELEGAGYGADEGVPFTSIQPEHLYKLWMSYDFGVAGHGGWLSRLRVSAGINGQSEGYKSGSVCPADQVGMPNPRTGIASCLVDEVPYEFTVDPYTIVSGRIDYRLGERWSAALNLENISDKTYYQSVGSVSGGNWYGAPRSFTLSVRSRF